METSNKLSVKCSVSNCQYNQGHVCHADNIEVNAIGDGTARTSDGTSCKTFVNSKHTSTF
jgi:hypothetical protein